MWQYVEPDEVIQKLNDGAHILDVDLKRMRVDNAALVSSGVLFKDLKSDNCVFFEKVKDEQEVSNGICDVCGAVSHLTESHTVQIKKRYDEFGGTKVLHSLDICKKCCDNIVKFMGLDERKE